MPEPLDARERRELCDLFEELGPDAPTLCEGWTTLHLAAHLVVRERDPRSGPGIVLGGRFEALLDRLMARAMERGYARLVEQVRNGPPLGPFAVPGLRKVLNLNEYVVHHEDVRRANGLGPRSDRDDLQEAVWRLLRPGARLMLRKVNGATVRVTRAEGPSIVVGSGREVSLVGEPVELLLYLQGRRGAAAVEMSGDESAMAALRTASLGI
ncbi:MAG: TIGR03085 family metal-binding protein [Actinomycetota bacterium]